MGDAEKLIAWLREAADELEVAHRVLDNAGVPRNRENPMTLAARIYTLIEARNANHDWGNPDCDCPACEQGRHG